MEQETEKQMLEREAAENANFKMEGWLSKKGRFFKNWKKRWFLVKDAHLIYLTEEKGCLSNRPGLSSFLQCFVAKEALKRAGFTYQRTPVALHLMLALRVTPTGFKLLQTTES